MSRQRTHTEIVQRTPQGFQAQPTHHGVIKVRAMSSLYVLCCERDAAAGLSAALGWPAA